jgi:hypothetical protein
VTVALQGALDAFLYSITNPSNFPQEVIGEWPGDTSALDPRILVEVAIQPEWAMPRVS